MRKVSRGRMTYYTIILLVAPILIYLFTVREMRFFLVPSSSMEPTLAPGDYLLTLAKELYERGDIVVMVDPKDENSFIVKRIVGMPGDRLAIHGGALFINGKYASEPYLPEPMAIEMKEKVVPEGGVFVMGDNRNRSEDSSQWEEALRIDDIVGIVKLRYLPLDRAGWVKGYPLVNSDGQ
jgi:signal peptidase I